MNKNIAKFFDSPANRAGLAAWVATALTALLQWIITRSLPPQDDLLGILIGFIAVIQPDNSVTKGQVERIISDIQLARRQPDLASCERVLSDMRMVSNEIIHPSNQA